MSRLLLVASSLLGSLALAACGDLALSPETIQASNEIRHARATQIALEAQDKHIAAAQDHQQSLLELKYQRHALEREDRAQDQMMRLRAAVLPIAYGVVLFGVLVFILTAAGRVILNRQVALVQARTALVAVEARRLEAELRLAQAGLTAAAPDHDGANGAGQPSPVGLHGGGSVNRSVPRPADGIRTDLTTHVMS